MSGCGDAVQEICSESDLKLGHLPMRRKESGKILDRESSKKGEEAGEEELVLMASIGAALGLKGAVRLHFFGEDPSSLCSYGTLQNKEGTRFLKPCFSRPYKEGREVLVQFEGILDRTEAERLRGLALYVKRSVLPPSDPDVFYHTDLLGKRVEDEEGKQIGSICALHNFGAEDIVEIEAECGASFFVPFRRSIFPEITCSKESLVAYLPEEFLQTVSLKKEQ